MNAIRKIDRIVYGIGKTLALACFTGLFIILMMNVLVRFAGIPYKMSWYTEVVEILFAYMVMTTASVLSHDKEHFKVDLLLQKFGNRPKFHYLEAATGLVSLSFFVLLFYFGLQLTINAHQTMPILQIPKRWGYSAIPVNAFFLCVYSARDAAESLLTAFGRRPCA